METAQLGESTYHNQLQQSNYLIARSHYDVAHLQVTTNMLTR